MKFIALLPFSFAAVLAAPSANGPTHTGQATFTDEGVGSCGFTNTNSQLVVGVSTAFFNAFPGATTNPNNNPICGKSITATFNGKSVTAEIVDKCVSCAEFDLNFSPTAFSVLANQDLGRISGVSWFVVGGGE